MKRFTFFFISCLLVLSGCSAPTKESGKVLAIGVDDAIAKIEKGQTFVLLVTRPKCEYCEELLKVLDDTIEDHKTVIYNAVMDDSNTDVLNKDIKKLGKYLKDPSKTPHYYYIKNGSVQDSEMGFTSALPDRFWDWITRNDIENLS